MNFHEYKYFLAPQLSCITETVHIFSLFDAYICDVMKFYYYLRNDYLSVCIDGKPTLLQK